MLIHQLSYVNKAVYAVVNVIKAIKKLINWPLPIGVFKTNVNKQ